MEIDFEAIEPQNRYKLLVGFVIPRPIALVTTRSPAGVDNAAPFSFFNVFSEDPAMVVLGLQRRPDGTLKDTARNILDTGEFVVNMVDEAIAEAMNLCSVDFPPEKSEPKISGLAIEPSRLVKPGRLADSPVSMECRHIQTIEFKPTRSLVLGEVVWMRARDDVIDSGTLRVRDDAYRPVGRLYAHQYARQRDRFELVRQTYPEWLEDQREKEPAGS